MFLKWLPRVWVSIIFSSTSTWGQVPVALPYIQQDTYQRYTIYKIPAQLPHKQAKCYVVETQTHNISYVVEQFLSDDLLLSSDGQTLVEVLNPVATKQWHEPCLRFYKQGMLKEQFLLPDLQLDTLKMQQQPYLTGWATHQPYFSIYTLADSTEQKAYAILQNYVPFIRRDTLFLVSADKILYTIILSNYNILFKVKAIPFFKLHPWNSPQKNTLLTWQLPTIEHRKDTTPPPMLIPAKFCQWLGKKVLKKKTNKYFVYTLWIEVNNLGKLELAWSHAAKVRNQQVTAEKVSITQLEQWLQAEVNSYVPSLKNQWIMIDCFCK